MKARITITLLALVATIAIAERPEPTPRERAAQLNANLAVARAELVEFDTQFASFVAHLRRHERQLATEGHRMREDDRLALATEIERLKVIDAQARAKRAEMMANIRRMTRELSAIRIEMQSEATKSP